MSSGSEEDSKNDGAGCIDAAEYYVSTGLAKADLESQAKRFPIYSYNYTGIYFYCMPMNFIYFSTIVEIAFKIYGNITNNMYTGYFGKVRSVVTKYIKSQINVVHVQLHKIKVK